MARFASARMFLLFTLLAWMTGSCVLVDEDLSDVGDPALTLAMTVKSNSYSRHDVTTKMSTSVTQTNGIFRGIENVYVIPFQTSGSALVDHEDLRLGGRNVVLKNSSISSSGLVLNNNSRLFDDAVFPRGMNCVLAYGKATEEIQPQTRQEKHSYGVLTAEGLTSPLGSDDIFFHLESILSTGENSDLSQLFTQADAILDQLNVIVSLIRQANSETVSGIFNTIKHDNQILACSYSVFNRFRTDIQTSLMNLAPDLVQSDEVKGIQSAVGNFSDILDNLDNTGDGFPASYGIPEGALGFCWNGSEFVRLINGVNIALVNPASYRYPPSLWYYVNSRIQTSNSDSVKNEYVPDHTYWEDILALYLDGDIVSSMTRSVAIAQPLQYAVGLLELSLTTPGGEAASTANGCPLTGIIVGDQRDVDFHFMPATFPNKSNPACFVYDNIVGSLKIGQTDGAVQTLVLPTNAGQTVHFALEFQNTSGTTLFCQQGEILPWCKFYLAGELDPASVQEEGQALGSVFSSDHKTSANVKVMSLRNAYNTVPDLHDPQLEIGVVTEMKWTQLTPRSVTLKL